MKQRICALMVASATVVSSCDDTCEYRSLGQETVTALLFPAMPGEKNCTNSPVVVKLLWERGGEDGPVLTSDGSNPPRACVEALGLEHHKGVQVAIEERTDDENLQCPYRHYTFVKGDMTACDAVCHEEPRCPASRPEQGSACVGSLSCSYGDHYDCPPDVGYTYTYDCVDGRWIVQEKGHCPVCAPNCDLPPPPPPPPECIPTCLDALFIPALPPVELMFCTTTSAMLYEAFWNCMCVAGNPCESACNVAPVGDVSLCNGGAMTEGCQSCLQTAEPAGCLSSFNHCMNDF